jgi:hypothetical protein
LALVLRLALTLRLALVLALVLRLAEEEAEGFAVAVVDIVAVVLTS